MGLVNPPPGWEPLGDKFFADVERHCLLCARLIEDWLAEVNARFPCPPGQRWVLGAAGLERAYWGKSDED